METIQKRCPSVMWMLVRRCGELCVSHVRSPGLFTVQSQRRASLDRRGQWRLTVELVQTEPSVSGPRFAVCMLLPSFGESSGLDSLPRSTLRILKTLHCSCLKIPFLATNVTYLQSHVLIPSIRRS